jgi:hypothetical protein
MAAPLRRRLGRKLLRGANLWQRPQAGGSVGRFGEENSFTLLYKPGQFS